MPRYFQRSLTPKYGPADPGAAGVSGFAESLNQALIRNQANQQKKDLLSQSGAQALDRVTKQNQYKANNKSNSKDNSGWNNADKQYKTEYEKNTAIVEKARDKYHDIKDPNVFKLTRGKTPQQVDEMAYQDMQNPQHPAHDAYVFTHDPNNLNKYHQILSKVGASSKPTTAQPAQAQPTGLPPLPGGGNNGMP